MTKVWVVFVSNYFPREVVGIYSNEPAAKSHADNNVRDLNYEVWTVEDVYREGPLFS